MLLRILAALFLSVFATQCTFAEDATFHFIANGKSHNVRMEGHPWKTIDRALVCSGEGNLLHASKEFAAGNFWIEVKLTITELAMSAASIVINDSHFGFDGKAGEMFVEGPVFGRRGLGKPIVSEGRPFTLTAVRDGDTLTISIDDKKILAANLSRLQPVRISLRPWRSTMHVTSFTGRGALRDSPKPLPQTTVFESGKGDYHTYRIPATVITKKGTLLAFCEGRKSGGGDAGNIDMLVSRSTDQGTTWSAPQVVWDNENHTCGNPAPVVDQETGTIWLPLTWNLGSDHERQIMAGTSQHPRHVFMTHSTDDGKTWSKPIQISETTRKEHWRWYATGPGNGIQLTRGPHKGRLLIPANHSDHSDADKHPYRSHVIWSDDHGKTWQLGGVHEDRTNESAVVELSDGSVMQAMRSYHGKNRRAMATSKDGGRSWGKLYLDQALDTPVCQANILRYSWPDDVALGSKSRILFASPRGNGRSHMTIWLSYDEGKTWPINKEIYAGGSAYSNLVALPDGSIGLLFERDGYRTISFVKLTLDWLEAK